jgi:hypothetical protein
LGGDVKEKSFIAQLFLWQNMAYVPTCDNKIKMDQFFVIRGFFFIFFIINVSKINQQPVNAFHRLNATEPQISSYKIVPLSIFHYSKTGNYKQAFMVTKCP